MSEAFKLGRIASLQAEMYAAGAALYGPFDFHAERWRPARVRLAQKEGER